jgi:hypothetical protein
MEHYFNSNCFEVVTAVTMKKAVYCDVMTCRLMKIYPLLTAILCVDLFSDPKIKAVTLLADVS